MLQEFLLGFALPVIVFAQNVTVTTQDPRIHFDGTWVVQDSGGHEYTATVGSSVSLTFPGTAVYWHATINPLCGIANVSVDNDAGALVDPSSGTTTNSTPLPAILFARSGLAPGISHSINITLVEIGSLGGPYMEVYNLSYTQGTPTSSTSGIASSSTATIRSNATTGTNHKSSAGAIAGGVVGSVFGVLLVLGLSLLIFRRRRRPGDSLTMPYTGARSSVTGMSTKSVPTIVPRRPPQRPPQPQPHLPSSFSPSASDTTPFGHPQTTPDLPSLSSYPSTSPLIPNRYEPAPSESADPPPPYIPRRS